MDAPLLIDAPEKESADRYPAWSKRADWSSGDALLAFWSAHPPALRDDFLNARAESFTINFRAEIMSQRHRQHVVWTERRKLIDWQKQGLPLMPDTTPNEKVKRKEAEAEATARLLSLRGQMRTSRSEVHRCVRYLRMLQPKKVNQVTVIGKMVGAMIGKPVRIIIQKAGVIDG